MQLIETGNPWGRGLAIILAVLVIVLVMRSPSRPAIIAPADALGTSGAPAPLSGQFEIRAAPSAAAAPAPVDGKIAVVGHNAVIPAGEKVAAGAQIDADAQQ